MRGCHGKLLRAFGLCLFLAGGSGCAQQAAKKWYDPFGLFVKKEEPTVKIKTSAERIKILRDLAKRADELTPDEQQQATEEIRKSLVNGNENEDDILVRAQMLRTVAVFPNPLAGQILTVGLNDPDTDVRVACCEAWGQRGGDEAVRLMAETLSGDTDTDVRLAAARSLGVLKDPKGAPALGAALDDHNPAIQFRAIESLRQITGKTYIDIKDWRQFVQGQPPEEPSIAARLRQLF
ncbi:MAG TPA: HEAT repeat domain-containing protein [Pirellulales bacterium]|nr:HEAT repeat domain-containing protein [Pirellulales bacterium]